MTLGLMFAQSTNGAFGLRGKLPWSVPEELQHFKDVTEGCTVIMGWRTMKSLGTPLSNRQNVVVSDRPKSILPGFDRVHPDDLGQLATFMRSSTLGLAWVIGGAKLIEEMAPWATLAHVSEIHGDFDYDVAAPDIDWEQWSSSERHLGTHWDAWYHER